MPNRCVVYGCDSIPNPKEGVFLFTIPFFNDDRQEAKRRRRRWVNFVDVKRKNFAPSKGSSICSKHFRPEDLTVRFALLPGQEKPLIPRLKRDEIGLCVYPTLQTAASCEIEPVSDRTRRKILKHAITEYTSLNNRGEPETLAGSSLTFSHLATAELQQQEVQQEGCDAQEPELNENKEWETNATVTEEESDQQNPEKVSTQKSKKSKKKCKSCARLRRDKRCWHERWKQQRKQLDGKKEQLQSANERVLELEHYIEVLQKEEHVSNETIQPTTVEIDEQLGEEEMEDDDYASDEDSLYLTETESEEEDPLTEDEADDPFQSLKMHGTNMRTEPKHIVFLSQLLVLFRFCHICKADSPLIEARQMGTEVVVSTLCKNPSCPKKEFEWHSQPLMKFHSGQKGPAGNFLLSMAVLFGGGSATKIFQIFAHMGLACISLRSFFKHQRNYLFPTIYLHWKNYQEKLLEKVKGLEDELIVAGDARHDSMGHNAKYGCYTIFCCNLPQIVHFSLVQRNQAESSNAMEFVGFKSCMEYLLDTQRLPISTLISDRHTSISCHMKKVLTNIKHYFDLWHLKKKIRKVLTKLAKEKSCEAIKDWIKPCENHLYWCALSTKSGDGDLIWAKFKSFLSHIINVHSNLDEPLFNKCAHREIRDRTWLEKGSTAHDKMVTALTKASIVKGIKQASPVEQTSGLEGFHSVVNHFSPKMIAYSYVGMYCRHVLAILHFNSNLHREVKYRPDGSEQLRVSYPKFKNGEATVRNICVKQNFDYVGELYDCFLESTKEEIRGAREDLEEMTPRPMNSILDKQPVVEAVRKRTERKSMIVQEVPSTMTERQEQAEVQQRAPAKAPPRCRMCKQPMKGHSKVKDCPRNKET